MAKEINSPRELVEHLDRYALAVSTFGGMNDLDKALYMAVEMLTYFIDRDHARDAERDALIDPSSILRDAILKKNG